MTIRLLLRSISHRFSLRIKVEQRIFPLVNGRGDFGRQGEKGYKYGDKTPEK